MIIIGGMCVLSEDRKSRLTQGTQNNIPQEYGTLFVLFWICEHME